MLHRALPGANASVIYNSLDVTTIRGFATACRSLQKGSVWDLIFVGRLTSIKKLELLFDACSMLREKGCPVRVLIVGDGAWRGRLEGYAKELGVDSCIDWVGACYDDELIAGYFRKSKFCVSPGNIGLMAMHALYNDTPVITHDDMRFQMPEAEVVKNGVNGFLFERDDPIDLSDVIERALSEDYEALSSRCYSSVAEHYTPESQSTTFWKCIYNL